MSKSYNNTIEIFEPESNIKKKVMRIVTDSTPVEEPKDPQTCSIFALAAAGGGGRRDCRVGGEVPAGASDTAR